MKPLKNILVTTDFSLACNNVIDTAIELCKQHRAVMHLMHVREREYILSCSQPSNIVSAIINDIDHEARTRLYEVYESILREHDIAVQIHMPTGIPFHEICKSASEMPIDLIVAGMHGTAGENAESIGTTACNIIKYATKPVLLIPAAFEKKSFNNILFPIRPSQELKTKYEMIKSLLDKTDSHVHIGIFSLPLEADKTASNNDQLPVIIKAMKDSGVSCSTEFYTTKNMAEKVIEISGLIAGDLVVISSALDCKYTQFYMGVYRRKIISQSKIPVLSFRSIIDVLTGEENEEQEDEEKSIQLEVSQIK